MQDLIHRQMLKALFLFLFQLLVIVFLFVAYQINLISQINDIIIGSLALFIILDLLFVWTTLNKIANSKKKTDIMAADIVGKDIQEAYSFGKIGLIITDESNSIIWTNEWFADIQSKIIDRNIFEWQANLIELRNNSSVDKVINIDIENRTYAVKLVKEANLYIFKDVTDFETVVNFAHSHSPAVGIITIDNYADLSQLHDDMQTNDILAGIQKTIYNYAKRYDLFVKKFRTDSYFVVCTRASYEKVLADNFSLIEEVRNDVDDDNELTLSIGFAVGSNDFIKLNELASSSLDVALSRGGDQVVISPYGENLIFIGGKTEAKSRQNRVKIRVLSKSLHALISDASNVFIMGHTDMDMDALGAALGVVSIVKSANKDALIIYDENKIETKTRKAFKQLLSKEEMKQITISSKNAKDAFTSNSLLIIVDVHRPSLVLAPNILDIAEKVAVIDHHRRAEEFVEKPVFVHIEPSASSASELVAELARYSEKRVIIPQDYATLMLSGILLDTNYYRQKTGIKTYDASLILKEYGANNSLADDFLKEDYEEHALKNRIMANAITPYFGVIIAKADASDIIDRTMLASVATEAIQIRGVNACFVIGRTGEKETRISARSDGTINVQKLLEKLGGGGHFTGAAAQFADKNIEEVNNELIAVLDTYLNDARLDEKK